MKARTFGTPIFAFRCICCAWWVNCHFWKLCMHLYLFSRQRLYGKRQIDIGKTTLKDSCRPALLGGVGYFTLWPKKPTHLGSITFSLDRKLCICTIVCSIRLKYTPRLTLPSSYFPIDCNTFSLIKLQLEAWISLLWEIKQANLEYSSLIT